MNLNVLGKENLTAQRPAVFIFNHRNNFDPIITAALVRDNFTGVGKKELESDPIAGTLGKLLDAAFIDRDDTKSAVQALKSVEDLARKGLSIVMAPEGTRLDTTSVGKFKKGPFRIAMSAGIPIVPVIIRNAETIGVPGFSRRSIRGPWMSLSSHPFRYPTGPSTISTSALPRCANCMWTPWRAGPTSFPAFITP